MSDEGSKNTEDKMLVLQVHVHRCLYQSKQYEFYPLSKKIINIFFYYLYLPSSPPLAFLNFRLFMTSPHWYYCAAGIKL